MHPRLSVNHACFRNTGVEEFIGLCRSIGARHVVLPGPHLLDDGPDSAIKALGSDGPTVEAIYHRFAIFPDLEADEGQAIEGLLGLIDIPSKLRAKSIDLVTGGRGRLDWERAVERFSELLAPAVASASALGITLVTESVGALYADNHIAHTLTDTVDIAERAGIGVCIDLFSCWTEGHLPELFRRAMPRCGLVQVSDYVLGDRSVPARAVPGDGAVPLEPIIGDLLEAGYTGVFDIELLGPRIDAEGPLSAETSGGRTSGGDPDPIGSVPRRILATESMTMIDPTVSTVAS